MKDEQRELYVFTKDHFREELEVISPGCVAPLVAVRGVVGDAIKKYCKDYCTKDSSPFSWEDFQEVSQKIYDEVMEGDM